jgi:hypothetical protein
MKLTNTLMMMTAVTFLWGCGEGMQAPTEPQVAEAQKEDTGQVESTLAASDPLVGYWTAGGWNVRLYSTGTGYWKNSPDPVCWPNDTVAWNFVNYQWTDPDGTRHYYGQSSLGGCWPSYQYYNTEYILLPDGRTMQEQAPQVGHFVIWKKVI